MEIISGDSMLIVDLANEIYLENSSPSDTGIPAISFWIRSSIGQLNLLLYENFCVDFEGGSYEILGGFGTLASGIVKKMYELYRINLDIRHTMQGIYGDSVIIAKDQEFSITRINKSEVLKTLTSLKKDAIAELTMMVHYYRSFNNGNGTVSQVAGDDFIRGHFAGTEEQYIRDDFSGI